ncbi:MAG: hypothetical protein R3A44_13895 [Caldilineaceae bacterium]
MLDINHLRLSQIKHQEMLKEAELQRQIRQARAGQPSRMAQMRNQLGALLSHLGQRLHNQSALPGSGQLQNNA